MKINYRQVGFVVWLSLLLLTCTNANAAMDKGIYISQTTLEDTKYLSYLIKRAKASGINTFVIDMDIPSTRYKKNIAMVLDNKIKYVARITMYPGGGSPQQIESEAHREKKYKLMQAAIAYGAAEI